MVVTKRQKYETDVSNNSQISKKNIYIDCVTMTFPALYFSAILFLSKIGYSYAWERYNDAFPDNAKYMNPVPLNETLRQMYADSSFKIKPVVPPTFSIIINFIYYVFVYLSVGIRRA